PQADGRQPECFVRCLQDAQRSNRNGVRAVDGAQPDAGVEEVGHSPASQATSTGSSRSAGSGIGLGQASTNVAAGRSGTTRANGFPRFTIWTVSPASKIGRAHV